MSKFYAYHFFIRYSKQNIAELFASVKLKMQLKLDKSEKKFWLVQITALFSKYYENILIKRFFFIENA